MNNSKKNPLFFFKISAKVALVKYLIFIFRNLFLYTIFLRFIADNAFTEMIYISSFLISIFIVLLNKKKILKLYSLAIKKEFFMLSINENELIWYNPTYQESFKIILSEIKNFYTDDDTLIITTNEKQSTIYIPIGSDITNLQKTLKKLGVSSIFSYTKDSKYTITKELISKTNFYFKKSVISMGFSLVSEIFFYLLFISLWCFFLVDPFLVTWSEIIFLIPLFPIFLSLINTLTYLFKLLYGGGVWEVIIINSKLIWNTPNQIKGSFVVNLSDISFVICEGIIDNKNSTVSHYVYSIKTVIGQEIVLDNNLDIDFEHLVSLLGVPIKYIKEDC